MTENKPIMIDGADVSGCKHFGNRTCLVNYLLIDMTFSEAKCELCKDCYFKQLARKTQECKKLKAKNKILKQSLEFEEGWKEMIVRERDELKAENKQLKRQVESDKGLITNAGKQNYQLVQEYDQLKATLTEIKEIAEDAKTKVFVDMEEFWKQILQIIDEVENEK